MSQKTIALGAEATITLNKSIISKTRKPKSYRLPTLDNKLRKRRTKKEIKLLTKASKLIPTPNIIKTSEFQIQLEYINGKRLSLYLEKLEFKKIAKTIGQHLTNLHSNDIIHGDLTTSNMIIGKNNMSAPQSATDLRAEGARDLGLVNKSQDKRSLSNIKSNQLYFIDYGLGFISIKKEDKATDLKVLKEALIAKHHTIAKVCWDIILKNYKLPIVKKQLEKVESRGRYKAQY
jgi:tRNA A-37 threonylcarbamoyl transferase component Bud32